MVISGIGGDLSKLQLVIFLNNALTKRQTPSSSQLPDHRDRTGQIPMPILDPELQD